MLIAIILCLFSVAHGLPYIYFIKEDEVAPAPVDAINLEPSKLPPSDWQPPPSLPPPSLPPPSQPPSPPPPPPSSCCLAGNPSCCPSISLPQTISGAKPIGPNVNFVNSGSSHIGAFVIGLPSSLAYRYNKLPNIPNPAFNFPYNNNYYYGGSQASYALRSQQEFQAPVSAAIINTGRTVEYRDLSSVSNKASSVPQVINVDALSNPVSFNFRTVPSPITITQTHTAGAASQVQQSQTVEQPQRLVHQLVRPIIHDVREIIQPFRHVTQEIQPLVENTRTIIARGGENEQNSGSQQSQVANAGSVENVQEVGEQVGQSQVPANTEPVVRGQVVVQAVADPNAAQQSVGSVQSVGQAVRVVSNSYQPFNGYSQQIPVVNGHVG